MEVKSKQFQIVDTTNDRPVAIISAKDSQHALERFSLVRSQVMLVVRNGHYLIHCVEHPADAPCTVPTFKDGFFDVLEAAKALKH